MKKLVFLLSLIVLMTLLFIPIGVYAEVQYTDNVIPAMTSNTSPSGVASASNIYNTDYDAWVAFDHLDQDAGSKGWNTSSFVTTGWLCYKFESAKTIQKYSLLASINEGDSSPKDWTFEGSNDGVNWSILDTRTDERDWINNRKKSYSFLNSNSYLFYRINVTANNGGKYVIISEMEMMEQSQGAPSAPINLLATAGDAKVMLKWNEVPGITSYTVKRSTTAGEPYETVFENVYETAYTDEGLDNGTTYYYIVIAVNAAGESDPSNEASATPKAIEQPSGNRAILRITFTNNAVREYDLSNTELSSFLSWYDKASSATGDKYYAININCMIKPFTSRKDYIQVDKIFSFEVNEYVSQ